MADTYGVQVADIASELASLFDAGFSANTIPSSSDVAGWITAADTIATLHVQRAAAVVPVAADQGAPLARRYVFAWVKAQVAGVVYAGADPERVAVARRAYDDEAKALLAEIDRLGVVMAGSGRTESRVKADTSSTPRALLVDDDTLAGDATRLRRW